jgi:hypothetical protein
MSTIKKLIVHYERMKHAVSKNEDLKTGITCYVCKPCNEAVKTELIDKGMVPKSLVCNNCKGLMENTNFDDVAPDHPPTWEWYMPKLKEFLKFAKKNHKENLNWVASGGLLMRAAKTKKS